MWCSLAGLLWQVSLYWKLYYEASSTGQAFFAGAGSTKLKTFCELLMCDFIEGFWRSFSVATYCSVYVSYREKWRAMSTRTWKCTICRYMSAVNQMQWASSLRESQCLLILEIWPGHVVCFWGWHMLWTCSIHHNSAKHLRCSKDFLWDLTHCAQSLPPDSWH